MIFSNSINKQRGLWKLQHTSNLQLILKSILILNIILHVKLYKSNCKLSTEGFLIYPVIDIDIALYDVKIVLNKDVVRQ